MIKKIVWNGVDGYIEADEALRSGYDFDGEKLYHGAHQFKAFEVVEVDPSSLPRDEDGYIDFEGCDLYLTETGRFYRCV